MNEEKENDEGQATRDLEPCTGKRSEDFSKIGSRLLERLLKKEVENEEVQATQGLEPCLRETEERSGASSTKAPASPPGLSKEPQGLPLVNCVTGVQGDFCDTCMDSLDQEQTTEETSTLSGILGEPEAMPRKDSAPPIPPRVQLSYRICILRRRISAKAHGPTRR